MCGIVGIINFDKRPFSHTNLSKMTHILKHRGPDQYGFFQEDYVALGHRRLAIIDTSEKAVQPMISKDGKWIVIYNGCIYNYLELKQDLKAKGHQFHTSSDTEVLVEGIAEYGPNFLLKLNGMFALGAWNKEKKVLYLSRDRFGVKPLYYWFNGKTFVFSSEIKAIIEHPEFEVELNYQALNEYFTFQNLFSFHTLFKHIYLLPPANTIMVSYHTQSIKHNPWWDYNFAEPDNTMSFEEAKNETQRLLKQSVVRQLIADVPVGSYLSGGMDSGSITAIASGQIERLTTFTCGFDMSQVTGIEINYDERKDAELLANFYKTEHYEQIINAGDLKWSMPRVVWHLEDLKVGMSYPNYYIARLASKFVKVCLQGTGGDELYGGYPWRYYKVFDSISKEDFFNQYYSYWQRLVNDDERKNQLFTPLVTNEVDINESRKLFERVFTFNPNLRYDSPEHHINNSLYFEIKTFLSSLLLVGDKLSMANGLEERFPFLDNDLVDFAQRIPVKYKLGNLAREIKSIDENLQRKKRVYQEFDDGKNVLRKAMAEIVPWQIIKRKKQGFSAPDESWYRGENADYINDLLLDKKTVLTEFINKKYIEKIIYEHINKRINNRLLIWSFMSFEWWCRIFLNGERIK